MHTKGPREPGLAVLRTRRELLVALGVAAVTLIVLALVHKEVVAQPNGVLFSDRGEGARNYFVLAFHGSNGERLHEFDGMNYPFGEQIVYSEGQPALSYPLQLLGRVHPWFSDHAVGALNLFLLLGIVGSAVILFWLFRRFGIELWFAAPAAVGIALLAPQNGRLPWMQPQAFSAAVPVTLLLLSLVLSRPTLGRASLLGLSNAFLLLINPYPGIIVSAFSGLALLSRFVFSRRRVVWAWLSFATSGLPPVLFVSYLNLTELHTGRPDRPMGFLRFTAEPCSIVGSYFSPVARRLEV